MILTMDIGNTFIKTAVFDGDKPVCTKKIRSRELGTLAFDDYPIDGCAVSSVVPEITTRIEKIIPEKFGVTPLIVSYHSMFSFKIEYSTPATLGTDRICGAEGAFKMFSASGNTLKENEAILSIDFGTATTINLVKYPSVFVGGIIAPGARMMFDSLNKNTSQLPTVSLEEYKNLIGDSTNSSIASGVLNSITGLIEKTIASLSRNNIADKVYAFITGGNAPSILPYITFEHTHEPELVLHGLNSVYLKNNS